jgi:hypothetical protein
MVEVAIAGTGGTAGVGHGTAGVPFGHPADVELIAEKPAAAVVT